jgi:hypothetical protein
LYWVNKTTTIFQKKNSKSHVLSFFLSLSFWFENFVIYLSILYLYISSISIRINESHTLQTLDGANQQVLDFLLPSLPPRIPSSSSRFSLDLLPLFNLLVYYFLILDYAIIFFLFYFIVIILPLIFVINQILFFAVGVDFFWDRELLILCDLINGL